MGKFQFAGIALLVSLALGGCTATAAAPPQGSTSATASASADESLSYEPENSPVIGATAQERAELLSTMDADARDALTAAASGDVAIDDGSIARVIADAVADMPQEGRDAVILEILAATESEDGGAGMTVTPAVEAATLVAAEDSCTIMDDGGTYSDVFTNALAMVIESGLEAADLTDDALDEATSVATGEMLGSVLAFYSCPEHADEAIDELEALGEEAGILG